MKRIIVSILIACLLAGVGWMGCKQLKEVSRTQKATQEFSKILELRTALATELENYYRKHSEYPHSLTDLPLENFDWGKEGATSKDLESFSYISDGQTFVMQWHGDRNYSVYLAGKKGESIFSESETNHVSIGSTNGR